MNTYLPHIILSNHFLLSAARTIFWEEQQTLILSDLHIGKSGHFRKHGIGIPQTIFKEDMQRLLAEVQYFGAKKLIIVGDLFHSRDNKEHDMFKRWRADIAHVELHLVQGNHDILPAKWYADAGITVHENILTIDPFVFTHDIGCDDTERTHYCFSGHIHPGIRMSGLGKQRLRLPCFYFNTAGGYAVLPAFGKFTGTQLVSPEKSDQVFALAENKIFRIQ
jgi:DNA ligase-associated metallophosphoesterase